MTVKVRYPNGAVGFASPEVAKILEKKHAAVIVAEEERKPPTPPKRAELLKKALDLKVGKREELDKLSDEDLADLVAKAAK